jgi:hypothetical protein
MRELLLRLRELAYGKFDSTNIPPEQRNMYFAAIAAKLCEPKTEDTAVYV